eukprot:TRINITY_DN486_c0_g1_i1.p1 TRINITY_DN486_c0_g1~~TRINITY_DN486_c0_g1_i1.p1  ORF type:complete len:312 (+),score=92.71 TRINITY_DN486_c0_g1_i1:38-973(+)
MAEAAIRKFLPKNEQIVMAWIGTVAGLAGLSSLRPKKEPVKKPETTAPADPELIKLFDQNPELEDLREPFGCVPPPFEAVGNKHGAPLRLSIYAPPAGGKGTQCANIVKKYGVVQFSTGDALRAQVKAGTEIGKKAKSYMDSGALVPNDVIEKVIKDTVESDPKIASSGYIFDGVCRTRGTSEFVMREGLMPHVNIVLEVPDDEVVRRVSGRRIDPITKESFHLVFAPPPPEIASRLIQRSDDNETVVRERLANYKLHKESSLAPYPGDTVITVDGLGKPAEVWARVDAVISGTKSGVTAARTRAAMGASN